MKSLQARGLEAFARNRAAKASRVQQPPALPVGDQFVLWALRQWQCELSAWERDGAFPVAESGLRDGFQMAGLLEALPEFAMVMDAILLGIGRAMEIHPALCSTISRDEAVLIALCGLAQADLGGPLAASLNAMLGAETAEIVGVRLTTFVAMLAAAGLDLASGRCDPDRRLH
jgi:hypothetical protein